MKIRKWLILVLMVIFLLATAITAQALKDARTVNHGTCGADGGSNLSWKLDSHGLLTLSGNGAMRDFLDGPFYFFGYFVNKAVINYGATNIGALAFAGCTATEISIPDSVTAIGYRAFAGCVNVEQLVIPDTVTSIGWAAFSGMGNMQSIHLPAGITRIEERTFSGCQSLTTLVIPEGVTFIGKDAFRNCNNLRVIVLPASLSTIEPAAFIECDNLWHIIYTGSQEQWEQIQVDPHCNEAFFTAQTHIGCSGLEVSWEVTQTATCAAKGKLRLTCALCDTDKTVATEKAPHHFDYVCHGFCVDCGEAGESAHRWNWGTVTKEPNCTEDGIRTYTCSFCEDTKQTVEEKNGKHVYDNKCDKDCNVCGKTRSTSHKWDEGVTTTEPTCGAEGILTYTCQNCKETKEEPIARLTDHSFDHDCDTDCNVCGLVRETAHVPGPPATTASGQVCTVCGKVLAPAIPETVPTEPTQPTVPAEPTDPTQPGSTAPTAPTTVPTVPTQSNPQGGQEQPADPATAILVILIIGITIGLGVALILVGRRRR